MGIKDKFGKWAARQSDEFARTHGEEATSELGALLQEIDTDLETWQRDDGVYGWIRLALVAGTIIGLTWLLGWEGLIAGALFSVLMVVGGNVVRRFYCGVVVHPQGVHGYNVAQAQLAKYSRGGPEANRIFRAYWMHKWANFLYADEPAGESRRWSWRIYALIGFSGVLLYWSVPVGLGFLAAVSTIFFLMLGDLGGVPTALYLGNSGIDSHRILKRIATVSGLRWISLLRETVDVDESFDSGAGTGIEALELYYRANRWSLRRDEDPDWIQVVREFIAAAAIIVVRPESSGAVREELAILAQAQHLQRVIVLKTDAATLQTLPPRLQPCVLSEEDAMDLIGLAASNPRLLRQRLDARFDAAGSLSSC